jgi:hypothetical protein
VELLFSLLQLLGNAVLLLSKIVQFRLSDLGFDLLILLCQRFLLVI